MKNEKIYIDFDGVIVDSQKKIDYYFSLYGNKITEEWNRFLANINWKKDVLPYSNEINNSYSILKELYKMKKEIYIFSRVFSTNEKDAKIRFLKERGIDIEFIPSFGRIKKSEVIKPNQSTLLVDDSKDNVMDWIQNNGKGIYFTNNKIDLTISNYMDFNNQDYYQDKDGKIYIKQCVYSLDFLLKR